MSKKRSSGKEMLLCYATEAVFRFKEPPSVLEDQVSFYCIFYPTGILHGELFSKVKEGQRSGITSSLLARARFRLGEVNLSCDEMIVMLNLSRYAHALELGDAESRGISLVELEEKLAIQLQEEGGDSLVLAEYNKIKRMYTKL